MNITETAPVKRTFAALTLADAMKLVPAERMTPWRIDAPPREPSVTLQENLRRLKVFDLQTTEAAKLLLIDALLAEIVPDHPHLKVWKAMPLEAETVTGIADYVFSPDYAYLKTPLLCVVEAKRDDFLLGTTQCIAEMVACRWTNRAEGHESDVFGIVSNGQAWQFYKLTTNGEVLETDLYAISYLPKLLGALDLVCAECARRIPTS